MLHVTLPERGMLPLGKTDLPAVTRKGYGKIDEEVANLALEVLRKDRAITADEFQQLLSFAKRLFKECIHICGQNNTEVVKSLKTHAALYTHPAQASELRCH